MQLRDDPGQPSVCLLRPGLKQVSAAQASFYMGHRDFLIESRECSCKCGGGVALHQQGVERVLLEQPVQGRQDSAGQVTERLVVLHQIQFEVRVHIEDAEHLIEHLSMLTGGDRNGLKIIRVFSESENDGSHLDRVRTRPENYSDPFLHCAELLKAKLRIAV